MFMGLIKSLFKMQQRRAKIKLNPSYNQIYARVHHCWEGPINEHGDGMVQ